MRRFVQTALMCAAFAIGSLEAHASQIHLATGAVHSPISLRVRTWIDDRVAKTEMVEEFVVPSPAGASSHSAILVAALHPGAVGIGAQVMVNGVMQVGTPAARASIKNTVLKQQLTKVMPSVSKTPVVLCFALVEGSMQKITATVTYTEFLPATACRIQYQVPARTVDEQRYTPDDLQIQVRAFPKITSLKTSFGALGQVNATSSEASLTYVGGQPVTNNSLDVHIETHAAYKAGELTVGWHKGEAYGLHASQLSCNVSLGGLPDRDRHRKVWVVIDDRFTGHQTYAELKSLCLEVLGSLKYTDEFDVFLYNGVGSYVSWRETTGGAGGPEDAAMWMMQSNGFTVAGPSPQPAAWLLSLPSSLTEDLDVVYVSYKRDPGPITLEEVAKIRDRGIQFSMIGSISRGYFGIPFSDIASATGGVCLSGTEPSQFSSIADSLSAYLRRADSWPERALSNFLLFDMLVPWDAFGVDSTTPGVLAMRIKDWGADHAVIDGMVRGKPHRWESTIDATNVRMFSTLVPQLWAHAFTRALVRLKTETRGIPSVLAEVESHSTALGLEFGIGSADVVFVASPLP